MLSTNLSRPRVCPLQRLAAVYLSANNRNGPLIDGSSIPCLDGYEVGFPRLVSGRMAGSDSCACF